MGRVHGGEGGSDHRHEVELVHVVPFRVPDTKLGIGGILKRLQGDGLRPIPGVIHLEKPGHNGGGTGIGIELAYSGGQKSPGNASEKSQDV